MDSRTSFGVSFWGDGLVLIVTSITVSVVEAGAGAEGCSVVVAMVDSVVVGGLMISHWSSRREVIYTDTGNPSVLQSLGKLMKWNSKMSQPKAPYIFLGIIPRARYVQEHLRIGLTPATSGTAHLPRAAERIVYVGGE